MSINFPPELLASLAAAAERAGTTIEEFVLLTLKARLSEQPVAGRPIPADGGPTMYDHLADYIGSIDGPCEPLSENTGEKFADIVAEQFQREGK